MPTSTHSTPSKTITKFANIVFVLGIVFSLSISVYSYYLVFSIFGASDAYLDKTIYHITFLGGIVFATLFGLGLRLRGETKVTLSVIISLVVIIIYAAELITEYSQKISQSREAAAEHNEVTWDSRTKDDVLNDLNLVGVKAYPAFMPNVFLNHTISNERDILPLGGISNVVTILNNESGYFPVIKRDEHGFNNPRGLYREDQVDIVLIGDSFTEGFSVHQDESIQSNLGTSKVISLGKGGNGPLLTFATLREYVKLLRPTNVLWLYYSNDMNDLTREIEIQSSILRKYLNEDNYSQNLMSRQEEVNGFLKNYYRYAAKQKIKRAKKRNQNYFVRIFQTTFALPRLRSIIGFTGKVRPANEETYEIFRNILRKSKKIVSGWGGNIYFVYLPPCKRYLSNEQDQYREFVMHTANELGIPVIDIHKEVFETHHDPLSLFPFRMCGHYNAEGYRLVADAIAKKLREDGVLQ